MQGAITPTGSNILAALGRGRAAATTTAYLMSITGLGERKLREEVRRLRLAGFVICSATSPPAGYYFPDTRPDTEHFVQAIDRRASATKAAAGSARHLLSSDGGNANGEETQAD